MIRAVTLGAQLVASPIAIPLYRAKRARQRDEVVDAARRNGLVPTDDLAVNQADRRMIGRVRGHIVVIGSEVFPRITVLTHWQRSIDIGFPKAGRSRVTFAAKDRKFNRLFGTRFIDPALVKKSGEEAFEALLADIRAFVSNWRGHLDDFRIEADEVEARFRHFPFVPALDPEVLDAMLPGMVEIVERIDATFGPGSYRVDEGEYLGPRELIQVGSPPALVLEQSDERL
jgi:hypothetical protein